MCSYVEIRNVWVTEESLWVSLLSRVPKPFQWWTLCKRSRVASGQQGGGQRMTVAPGSPRQLPDTLQDHLLVENHGMDCCRTYWKKEVISSTLSMVLCVLQTFFQQVLFTYGSELKEQLCSRPGQKAQACLGGASSLLPACPSDLSVD